ncbi:MAG: hypothetical protein V3V16_00800 [Melioribacteraceae bacterium]
MTDSLLNIINIQDLQKTRKPSDSITMPKQNTLVTVTILERLELGVKVLIDGKLFIAIINENVAMQEELIAWVTDSEKFELSLNLSNQFRENSNYILSEINTRFGFSNSVSANKILTKIIEERKPVIKSKVKLLFEYIQQNQLKLSDSQIFLLINILWDEKGNSTNFIEELFENILSEPFENVCKQLFEITNEIIFAKIPSFIIQQINKTVYDSSTDNVDALYNKKEIITKAVISLNNYLTNETLIGNRDVVEKYVEYGTKYILQKTILQQYNCYPEFVIAKNENELILIMLEIKKYYSNSGEAFYNIVFKQNAIPLELKGIVRNKFLSGNIIIDDEKLDVELIRKFQQDLKQNWDINSHISFNQNNDSKQTNRSLENGINAFA